MTIRPVMMISILVCIVFIISCSCLPYSLGVQHNLRNLIYEGYLNANDPMNHSCMALIKASKVLGSKVYDERAVEVINSMKPGIATQYGDTEIQQTIGGKCVIPDYGVGSGNSPDIKSYKIRVIKKPDESGWECRAETSDMKKSVVLPYNNDDTQVKGCMLNFTEFHTPEALESKLIALYQISKEDLQKKLVNIEEQKNKNMSWVKSLIAKNDAEVSHKTLADAKTLQVKTSVNETIGKLANEQSKRALIQSNIIRLESQM